MGSRLAIKPIEISVVSLLLTLNRFDTLFSALVQFMPLLSLYTPWQHQKTSGFLMLPGSIERDQWHEIS